MFDPVRDEWTSGQLIRHPAEVFPFGAAMGRSLDADHSTPYVPRKDGGPPGQTAVDKLGPLARRSHRAVIHSSWRRCQPGPGTHVFRSPHGYVYLVTNQGTLALGCTEYAQQVWRHALDRASPPAAA